MARSYIPAKARCRQLERLVVLTPGITIVQLREAVGISYQSTCAYMKRLVREKRVEAALLDPAMPHQPKQFFFPFGAKQQKKAA